MRNKFRDCHPNDVIASCDTIVAKQSPEKLLGLLRRIEHKNYWAPRNDAILKNYKFVFITLFIFFFSSCSSPIIVSKPIAQPIKKTVPTISVVKKFLPEGWADITSKSKQSEIQYWLINHTNSATMVLRELHMDSLTQRSLLNDELNVVTNISLLSKLPENNSDYRVTRVPAVIDEKRNLFSYVYSEKGLLRRVIVFKKQQKYFELELMQERSSEEFEELTNDLLLFAVTLYER